MKLTEEEMKYWSQLYFKQQGQRYPCSNQTVVCGIITNNEEKALKVMEEHGAEKFIKSYRFHHVWKNGNEYWHHFTHPMRARGYRFYKIKIDKDIEREDFLYLQALCSFYCCEMEFI